MTFHLLVLLIFAMGASVGFYLGCKVSDIAQDGISDADEYKAGGSD